MLLHGSGPRRSRHIHGNGDEKRAEGRRDLRFRFAADNGAESRRDAPVLTVSGTSGGTAYAPGVWSASDVVLTFTNNGDTLGTARLYGYVRGQPENRELISGSIGGLGSSCTKTYDTTQNTAYCFVLVSEAGWKAIR
jgi:hypothetical protein